jgi:hypothetical protein
VSPSLIEFAQFLPVLALGLSVGWAARGWLERRARGERVVGDVRELWP